MSTKVTSGQIVNSTLDSSPVGATTPASGSFTTLIASALAALNGGATTLAPADSDSSNRVPTTAWVQALLGGLVTQPDSQTIKIGSLIIKMGIIGSMGGGDSNPNYVPFTNPFPTEVLGYACCTTGGNDRITYFSGAPDTDGFTINNNGSGAGASWIVIGK